MMDMIIGPNPCSYCGGRYGDHYDHCEINPRNRRKRKPSTKHEEKLICEFERWFLKTRGRNPLYDDGTVVEEFEDDFRVFVDIYKEVYAIAINDGIAICDEGAVSCKSKVARDCCASIGHSLRQLISHG